MKGTIKRTVAINKINKKREQEKKVVSMMIEIYCKGNKHGNDLPCPECQRLTNYANDKINRCPFMESKTFCSSCKVHCYNVEMRSIIKDVMKYSGPRMLVHRPLMAIRHLIETKWI